MCCGYLFQLASCLYVYYYVVHVWLLNLRMRVVSYTFQTLVSILVNGKTFEGTADYASTDMRLQTCTGRTDITCISQFVPTVFSKAQTIYKLLLALHSHHLCCFLTGTFALYVAGRLDAYDGFTIMVALTDFDSTPILRLLMQKNMPRILRSMLSVHTNDNDDAYKDLFHYSVSCDYITMPIWILGIDTDRLCGPLSNVDLVYLV